MSGCSARRVAAALHVLSRIMFSPYHANEPRHIRETRASMAFYEGVLDEALAPPN
jgi:Cdc6-like AAA superfamily ATPase